MPSPSAAALLSQSSPLVSLRDAYAMGIYVSAHWGTVGAWDRAYAAEKLDGSLRQAYILGRDKHWRFGDAR